MSRLTAFGFVIVDAALSLATIVQSTLTLAIVLLSVLGSLGLAFLSGAVQSLLWPKYFWDDNGDQHAV
ncbi:hypothetical protein [Stieleria mannarensis]|uniref:hypothetical protein n=1 Tax=Stieleria mannarensis TaxID=2755585 RepID=UPI001603B66C|nr:hypothetical protein [Rhodopirellula sp. JC639]